MCSGVLHRRTRTQRRWGRALASVFVSALALTPVAAQTQADLPVGPLTLADVLSLAERRSEAIAIARMALQRADVQDQLVQTGKRPQLSGSATYERSVVNEFSGLFGAGSGGEPCPAYTLNPAAGLDARVSEIERAVDCGAIGGGGLFGGGGNTNLNNLPFGRANTWRATLSFSQPLYSGGRVEAASSAVAVNRASAGLAITGTTAQLLFDVTQAYYDAVLSERLVAIAQATIDQAAATLTQTRAGFDAGTQPEFEVLRASVNRDNQVPTLIRQRVNRDLALLRLKQKLELPPDFALRLSERLDDDQLAPSPVFAKRVVALERTLGTGDAAQFTLQSNTPLPERNAVQEAAALVRLREAELKVTEAERKPTVNLVSTYSRIAFPSGLFPTFNRQNWAVGAQMNVPILTGGRQRANESMARVEIEQARLQQRQAAELAALDTRSAWAELVAARATWQASAGTIQQATRAYEIASVRFGAGVSTQLELSDARLLLQQAEANRAVAARELQVARARASLLPNLPLGGGTSTAAAPTGTQGGAPQGGATTQAGTR